MKKFYMWSAIIAGIMLAVGLILAFVSSIVGGKKVVDILRTNLHGDEWEGASQVLENVNDFVGSISDGNWYIVWNDEAPLELTVNGNKVTSGEEKTSIKAQAIKSLDLELAAGTFIVKEKETDDGCIDIFVTGVGDCDYYVEGDTLHVEGFKWHNDIIISEYNEKNKIILEMPVGMKFDKASIDVGAGTMKISDFEVKELEAVIGAGMLELKNIAAQEFIAEVGAGGMDAEKMDVENAEIVVGLGECCYQGWIREDLDAECGMGNMKLELKGKEKDHNYEIECSAGNIDMAGFSMVALLAGERTIDNGADSCFSIVCNMGNITIEFEEE